MTRGHLADSASAPDEGERVEQLVAGDDVAVEHIVSGRVASAVEFDQDHDEWVVVLEGSAQLEVMGRSASLAAGDWLLLPRGTPHVLVHTEPGTRWLAVRFGSR